MVVQALLLSLTLAHNVAQVEQSHQAAASQSTPSHHLAHTQHKDKTWH
jgi:hypothetical protein